jgi:hypothetical protein
VLAVHVELVEQGGDRLDVLPRADRAPLGRAAVVPETAGDEDKQEGRRARVVGGGVEDPELTIQRRYAPSGMSNI